MTVEAGWALDIPILRSTFPGLIAMNPTSALLFLLVGATFLCREFRLPATQRVAFLTSLCAIAVGSVKDLGYLFGKSLPVDRLIFWSQLDPNGPFHGTALAPNSALCFVLVGLALPSLVSGKGRTLWPNLAVAGTFAIGVIAFFGYVFSALPFFKLAGYPPMSLPTSLAFMLMGVGCIALRPNEGIARVFTEDAIGSILVRRVLPVATLTPFLIGLVRAFVQSLNILAPTEITAVALVSTMSMIALLILGAANTLNATDRKRKAAEQQMSELAERLREAAVKAEQASNSKSQFLANMSHEVRTPLNGVLGTTSLLESRELEPDVRKLVSIVRSSGETLLRVIDDILDFSKIEAGKLEIDSIPVDVGILVSEMVSLYKAQADMRGITIMSIIPDKTPCIVVSDPVRIKQVLGNLISNAVKFTSIGGVYVYLEVEPLPSGLAEVSLAVRDTGIGIAEDRQAAIFESFTQEDGTTSRTYGGTGLGLAICKRIVDLMGGTLTLSSRPQRGSTFTVRLELPFAPAIEPKEVKVTDILSPIRQRVLLAEDNEINAMVASSFLQDLGCTVVVVSDGVSAIAAMEAERFDTILMDIHMPICDGLEATRTIRQTAKGKDVRIIALTASALFEDQQASLHAGMDGFLSKPFTRDGLAGALIVERGRVSPRLF